MLDTKTKTLVALAAGASWALGATSALAQAGVAPQGQKCGTSSECSGELVCIARRCQPPPGATEAPAPPSSKAAPPSSKAAPPSNPETPAPPPADTGAPAV